MVERLLQELIMYAKASVAIQVRQLQIAGGEKNLPDAKKPETLLARFGLTHKESAEILGKKPDAVKKAVSRARQARGRN